MGNYGAPSTLPMTGGGIAIGGIFFDQIWLVLAAVALVAVGATMIRYGFRSGQSISD